jgi:hypothetical protein
MAKADVRIVDAGGANVTQGRVFRTEAGGTDILAGEPVKIGGTGNNYVVPLDDAEPAVGTDRMIGIAQNNSDHTASADGTVQVYMVHPNVTVMRAKAKDAAAIDTDAELLAILNDSKLFDLTGGVYTIDETVADATANGVLIVGGDIANGTLDFVLKEGASIGGAF